MYLIHKFVNTRAFKKEQNSFNNPFGSYVSSCCFNHSLAILGKMIVEK
jgi:hypothetical protein